ncbi:UNVERIFIED_CONTAM: hypothetical protein FKN15_059065 [Acipenser sinensis]
MELQFDTYCTLYHSCAPLKPQLQGPIEVIHKVKARVDCKGSKNELTVKQGETIDIIRITENPEGKWLGRSEDGSYGYIKTVSVEIDYDSLKRQQKTALTSPSQRHVKEQDQDVYDDVGQEEDVVSLLKLKADPRKQKKFEKEEKEFRKKFKYDGEIQVLHQVTVVPALANKKWGGKDLPLKPGEVLDLIQKAVDNKMICRNDEGKCKLGVGMLC